MKKISMIVVLAMLPCVADAARYSNPYKMNNYKSNKELQLAKTRTVNTASESRFYVGIHADLSLLSWKNEYKEDGVDAGSEKFNNKSIIGVDASFGYKFNNRWATELELGYMGKYSKNYKEDNTEFDLSTGYAVVNGYYNLYQGLYIGAGTGIAITNTSIEPPVGKEKSKTGVSPMGALMAGYIYKINDNISIDARYRFSMFYGPEMSIPKYAVDLKTGVITNHTVSLGIKYGF